MGHTFELTPPPQPRRTTNSLKASAPPMLEQESLVAEEPAVQLNNLKTEKQRVLKFLNFLWRKDREQTFVVSPWDGKQHFSDLVRESYLATSSTDCDKITMLYESPATSCCESSFFNPPDGPFRIHDYPPANTVYKSVLGPLRYSVMTGDSYPIFLADGAPPKGLVQHWKQSIPNFVEPKFCKEIPSDSKIYAYLPVQQLQDQHVHDPHLHYHLAGKDTLPLMTDKTPALLPNTQVQRPCIAKTTHSMGSKGIFVIRDDEDQEEFQSFLEKAGNPGHVVSELVNVTRNIACHFFVHPPSDAYGDQLETRITWFGSNENRLEPDGSWSVDSTIFMQDQEHLKQLQLPFVQDVARYCQSLGFWGPCGIDVLMDSNCQGHLVDVNPRVTGSCPAILVAHRMQETYGFSHCLFRRAGRFSYQGTSQALLSKVERYNRKHEGHSLVVLISMAPMHKTKTLVNLAAFSHSEQDCQKILDKFAPLTAKRYMNGVV